MPKQLRGPFEKTTSQILKVLDLAEAIGREETRAPEQKSLLKLTRNDSSDSRLSSYGIRHEPQV